MFVVAIFDCSFAQTNLKAKDKAAGDPIVMRVGERGITVAELCSALTSLPPPQRKGYALHPALARDWYGPLVALADEARRRHLQVSGDPRLSEVDSDNALVGSLIQVIADEAQPTNAQIDKYYAEHKKDFEQVQARHILISQVAALNSRSNRSAAEAKTKAEQIVAELNRGAAFARLTAENSDDQETRDKGGDLGYVSHHQLEPAVDSMLWSLAPGQTSAPFEGRFGYEIVQVEEHRIQPLAAVRESIRGRLKADALERTQQKIVSAAHISLEPAYTDSPLPCEVQAPAFTLKDPPLIR